MGAWTAPVIAFLLMVSIAWFLMWRWFGDSVGSGSLAPDVLAAIAARTVANRPPVSPMRLPNGDAIIAYSNNGPFSVRAGVYQMSITVTDSGYAYRYVAARAKGAYSGDDLKLANLVGQLSFNPVAQRGSGAPQELIDELRKNHARKLLSPPLQLSDDDIQNLQNLWTQYALAQDPTSRNTIGTKLLESLAAAGKASEPQNRAVWDANLAAVRQLISPQDEQKYRDNIRKAAAFRFAASNPSPSTN